MRWVEPAAQPDGQRCLLAVADAAGRIDDELPAGGPVTVDHLGAELHRKIRAGRVGRQDAPAHPGAGFENEWGEPGGTQSLGAREAGRTGSHHRHIDHDFSSVLTCWALRR